MMGLIERFQKEGVATRQEARRATSKKKATVGRPRNFVFHYQPKEKSFRLALQFRRADVDKREIIRTLQAIIDELGRAES